MSLIIKSISGNKYFLNESDLDLDLLQQNKKILFTPGMMLVDLEVLDSMILGMFLQN